jgi:hypothetical protein
MSLQELSQIKRWLRLHGNRHPLELHVWDLVLMCWVLGWVGVPTLLLLNLLDCLPLCLAASLLPTAYARARRRLHRQGRLRCDWLTAL